MLQFSAFLLLLIVQWLFPDWGRRVALELAPQQCDIIHVQHSSQYLPLIRALNPKAKSVFQLHAELFPQCNLRAMARRQRHADLISSVSHYITHKIRQQFPQFADRFCTFPNGIDVKEFDREKDYTTFTLRNRQVKRILYTGAVSPHKGIHTLIDTFNRLVERYPDVELEIVGVQVNYPIDETFALKRSQYGLEDQAPLLPLHAAIARSRNPNRYLSNPNRYLKGQIPRHSVPKRPDRALL